LPISDALGGMGGESRKCRHVPRHSKEERTATRDRYLTSPSSSPTGLFPDDDDDDDDPA
jgi:hypothetical protein